MKNALGKVLKNARGFPYIEFKDSYGERCSLQASSIILGDDPERLNHPGTSAVWLGCDESPKPHSTTGELLSPRMHLNRQQVAALIHTLQQWLRTGKFV